jgi:polysaccharide biosynthesis/export protein
MTQDLPTNVVRLFVASFTGVYCLIPSVSIAAEGNTSARLEFAQPSGQPSDNFPNLPQAVPQEDTYIIGPGDSLALRFLNLSTRPDLSGPVEVISDGTATVPLIGSVRLSGLTLSQASLWLQTLYARQLLRPELDLVLVRPRPIRVAIVGQVERPGVYTLTERETSQSLATVPITGVPTLVDAIQKSGGITADADLRQVTLRRRLPGEAVLYRRARVNLLALIQEGDLVQNPILFDGDVIVLPKAEEPVAELSELASTTIAPQLITVNVVGEVVRPGPVQVKPNTPLVQAVLAAGGEVVQRADANRVDLVRINRNGTLTRLQVPYNIGAPASSDLNPPLRDRDVIVVHRNNYARVTDALNSITRPLVPVAQVLTILRIYDDIR